MASPLTRAEVERIAELARLSLAPGEAEKFARELTAILQYAADIDSVNTTEVLPTIGIAPAGWREDEPAPCLPRHAVLDKAPDANRDAGLFRVPKVL